MPNALGLEVQRSPNRIRTCGLARMCGKPQAMLGGKGVDIPEELGGGPPFVASNAEAHDVTVMILQGWPVRRGAALSREVFLALLSPQDAGATRLLEGKG